MTLARVPILVPICLFHHQVGGVEAAIVVAQMAHMEGTGLRTPAQLVTPIGTDER